MPSSVAVVVPVMNRPASAAPFMETLRASLRERSAVEVYAVASWDDKATAAAWEAEGANVVRGAVVSFASKANLAYQSTREPWLLFTGDDVAFHAGWLEACMTAGAKGAVVSTNDCHRTDLDRLAIHPFVDRTYIELLGASWDGPGVFAHEGYRHWCCDLEWSARANALGQLVYAPDARIEHMHPLWGKGVDDDTYRIGQASAAQDRRLYAMRYRRFGRRPQA